MFNKRKERGLFKIVTFFAIFAIFSCKQKTPIQTNDNENDNDASHLLLKTDTQINDNDSNLLILKTDSVKYTQKDKTDSDSNPIILKIENITIKPIQTKNLFSSVEYIFLETLPECLLNEDNMEISVTDKYIVANNKFFGRGDGAYLFDRKTGKFLYEIGKKGQGPGEYQIIHSYPFNEKYELFYVNSNLQRVGIDINTNKEVERVFKMVSEDSFKQMPNNLRFSIDNIFKMDSLHYIAYKNNDTGNDTCLLVIFDKEENIVKTYPNHQKYKRYDEKSSPFNPGHFYSFNNQLFFKEYFYNDTVFRVNLDTIIPHIIFDLGKKKPDYTEQRNRDKTNWDCYWIGYVCETTKYILFSFAYHDSHDGYYNKKNGEFVASLGFVHEKDFYPPIHISSINQYEEVIGVTTATKMLEYIETNKQTNKQTKYPEKFNFLKEDDNPIVVIATLK